MASLGTFFQCKQPFRITCTSFSLGYREGPEDYTQCPCVEVSVLTVTTSLVGHARMPTPTLQGNLHT